MRQFPLAAALALALVASCARRAPGDRLVPPPQPVFEDATLALHWNEGRLVLKTDTILGRGSLLGTVVVSDAGGSPVWQEAFEFTTIRGDCVGCDPYPGAPADVCDNRCSFEDLDEWSLEVDGELVRQIERSAARYRVEIRDLRLRCEWSRCSPSQRLTAPAIFVGEGSPAADRAIKRYRSKY